MGTVSELSCIFRLPGLGATTWWQRSSDTASNGVWFPWIARRCYDFIKGNLIKAPLKMHAFCCWWGLPGSIYGSYAKGINENNMSMIWLWKYTWMAYHINGLVQQYVTPLLTHWSNTFLALTHQNADTEYHKSSNISHTPVGNEFFYHSDVVGTSPVGAAPTISSFST